MVQIATTTTERLTVASGRIAESLGGADVAAVDEEVLLRAMRDIAEVRNAADLVLAALAAEAARRSERDRGYDGLAQRKGHRTVGSLVQTITGQSKAEVTRAMKTGEELAAVTDTSPSAGLDSAVPAVPTWERMLSDALERGSIASPQYRAIRTGLGAPPVERYPELDPQFLPQAWAQAVEILLEEAHTVPVEQLRADARTARDRLDPVGVTLRFEERFAARSLRTWIDEAGQHQARISFDDEAAAWVHAIMNAALRPRRGPRFVGEGAKQKAADAAADERTNEQLQYDTLIAVLRAGAAADPQRAFGDRQPGVRIVVEASAIADAGERGEMRVTGVGHLEDGGQALPGGVIEKHLCDAGSLAVSIDQNGRPLDLGRERRLFSAKQRTAIAIREGGCIGPSCTAPPSWCEYHHIDHWWEHHGKTDVDDGVPLCRNCHLRCHNLGWRITRERDTVTGDDSYWLHKPPDPATGKTVPPERLRSASPRRFAGQWARE
ncbi:HNH endonuclease signature motif containing protein [Microbacterium sp. A1-JK]|uniref:HNH endonuclease signature motif containing protein n=1 Tax=Microbacterium sp. A1-JK TaxID=3177516 RepID=UPI003883AF0D